MASLAPFCTDGMYSVGMSPPPDLVYELEPLACFQGLQIDHNVSELSVASGLFNKPPDALAGSRNGLPVGHFAVCPS